MHARIRAFDVPLGTVFVVHNPNEKESRATLRVLTPTDNAIRGLGLAYFAGLHFLVKVHIHISLQRMDNGWKSRSG